VVVLFQVELLVLAVLAVAVMVRQVQERQQLLAQ
jgi:hypothetical protein